MQNDYQIAARVSAVSILVNLLLFVLKLLAGLLARSGTMVSDAVHSLSDILSTVVVMIGVRAAAKAPDKEHPYGHERMECVAAIVLAVLYAGQAVLCAARRRYGFLRITAVLTLVIPAALGGFALLDWERLFIGFHRLAFRNDYWLFDPATDPVINALPDTLFFHCAAAILILVLLGSILCEIAYRILRNN